MKLRPTYFAFAPAMMVLTMATSSLYAQDTPARANTPAEPAAREEARQDASRSEAQQAAPRAEAQAATTAKTAEKRAAPTGAAAQLTDGQILQIVRTINDAEIKQAKEATDEGTSESVKQVAEMIMTDHEASNEQMDELLEGSLNMEDSALNETIGDQAEETHELLQNLAGAEYDCAYLQQQVAQHEMAIETGKSLLMPQAKDAGIKAYLTAMEPKLQNHLKMAQEAMGSAEGCSAPQTQQSQAPAAAPRTQQ